MSDGWGAGNGTGADFGGPDWAAMAEQHEREQSRRKRLRTVGAVVAATVVIGGITASAVALAGKGGDRPATVSVDSGPTSAADLSGAPATGSPADPASASGSAPASPSASASAASSGPAKPASKAPGTSAAPGPTTPPDPLTVISAAATDTAPLSPGSLFPEASLNVGGKVWTRLAEANTAPCYQTTTGGLGDVLAAQGCRTMLRVTYVSGSSAVTIGVAVLDSKAQADAAAAGHHGQLQGLVPAGNTSFCTSAGCANTHGTIGRYAYYTVSGTVKPGGVAQDPVATAGGPAFAALAHDRLLARGKR